MSSILINAKDRLLDHGFTEIRRVRDQGGIVGFWLERGGERYIMVAKRYAHNGLASFIREAHEFASEKKADLIFYENERPSYTIFEQEVVEQHGSYSSGDSRKGEAEWKELPLRHGERIGIHR